MKIVLLLVMVFFTMVVFAKDNSKKYEDTYTLSFTKDINCTLVKNNNKIPTFDLRFKKKEPKNAYTCSAIQKEQYNDCIVVQRKNVSALFFGYGVYEYTNLILAFQNPDKSVDSSVTVSCTKKLPKK